MLEPSKAAEMGRALESLAHLDERLDPQTKLYRITDFFSAALIVAHSRLRLTRVSDYSDRNEGVDRLVRALVHSAVADAIDSSGVHDAKSADRLVNRERDSHFVSCWSRNEESHAMWSMYSPDQCGIKLHTTVGKLHAVARASFAESWAGNLDKESPASGPLACEVSVQPVEYADVHTLLHRLARRKALADRLVSRAMWTSDRVEYAVGKHRTTEKWRRYLQPGSLKDKAYAYEDEVRLTVRLASIPTHYRESVLTNLAYAATAATSQNSTWRDRQLRIADGILKYVRSSLKDQTHLEVAIPPVFIDAVTVDPRAPDHKRRFIEEHFAGMGIAVRPSTSFDAAYHDLAAYPDPEKLP